MTSPSSSFYGSVAIIGHPNCGKSTLVNALVGAKVSIVCNKVQTTRRRILGILTQEIYQAALIDTPGIFRPNQERRLEKAMVKSAWLSLKEANLIIVLIDAKNPDFSILNEVEKRLNDDCHVVCAINKIDLLPKEKLLPIIQSLNSHSFLKSILLISALNHDGLDTLKNTIFSNLPQGPWLFAQDQLSDLNERFWAAEITREEIYLQLHQEIPYQIYIDTEKFEEFDNGSIKISQVIILSKENHKSIVLGHHGSRIKMIGERSRKQIAHHLGVPVHLKLFVKVCKDWIDKPYAESLAGIF
jgi:GTP-binding protein Era